MFIGIQFQKDEQGNTKEHKALIKETREELENTPCMFFDRIDEVEWAEMYAGVIYVDKDELKSAKQANIRSIRDSMLSSEIDPVVSNPLRWADLSDEAKEEYAEYRTYLLDYTKAENWEQSIPLSMADWKASK